MWFKDLETGERFTFSIHEHPDSDEGDLIQRYVFAKTSGTYAKVVDDLLSERVGWSYEISSNARVQPIGVWPSADIPRDKNYPPGAVQCDNCGGRGCAICSNRGWFISANRPHGRRCAYRKCKNFLAPGHAAIYCSNWCAAADASPDPPRKEW